MKYIWIPLLMLWLGVMVMTWKYSNYALYDRINTLEEHYNTLNTAFKQNVITEQTDYQELLKRYKEVQYQVDILTERLK